MVYCLLSPEQQQCIAPSPENEMNINAGIDEE
jgi:hypothetical protein